MSMDGLNTIKLTRRQWTILQSLSEGKSTPRIAADLCVSERTVSWHLNRIYHALNVKSRHEAVVTAHKLGLVSMDYESQSVENR